jgi:NitT/TauT family transport system substrate-binding protein
MVFHLLKKWFFPLAAVLALAVPGAFFLLKGGADQDLVFGDDPQLPTLTFYTTGSATTPQLAFWAAIQNGEILEICNIHVRFWKNLDDLRAMLLAGKGDLWLGHTEGFAQAHGAGAPVQLLFISGWRKFFVVSTDPEARSLSAFQGRDLPYAPHGSPAVPVLRALQGDGGEPIGFKPYEPKQLALMLISGRIDAALVPEPLVTRLLEKVDGLQIIDSVEDIYGRHTGQAPRMPIAGIAVNTRTVETYPRVIRKIAGILLQEARKLEINPLPGVDALPDVFEAFMTKEQIRESLQRDKVLSLPAADVQEEIQTYLGFLMPGREFAVDRLTGVPLFLRTKGP